MIGLIGSTALKANGFDVSPRDVDLVGTYDEVMSFINETYRGRITSLYPIENGNKIVACLDGCTMIEAEIAWPGSTSEELLSILAQDGKVITFGTADVPSEMLAAAPDVCLMLKMTHRFKKNSPFFQKTRLDIKTLRSHGITVRAEHVDFMMRRQAETLDYQHPNLKRSKAEFFSNDSVEYTYDHDTIHEAICLFDKPAYQFFKKEGADVLCLRSLFEATSQDVRMAAVYEESCVLAIERSLVPFPGRLTVEAAYLKALEKVCTSITSGWFREFAYDHYDDAVALFHRENGDRQYDARFRAALVDGRILPFSGPSMMSA